MLITLAGKGGERRLRIEPDRWNRATLPILELTDAPVAARGGWEDGETFVARVVFYETPYVQTHSYKFTGDQVTVTRRQNVAFGPGDLPALTGRVS
jgi:hypothetical protein